MIKALLIIIIDSKALTFINVYHYFILSPTLKTESTFLKVCFKDNTTLGFLCIYICVFKNILITLSPWVLDSSQMSAIFIL